MYGLSSAEVATISSGEFDGFSPAETALLRMADAMAETPANVSDELYAQLRRHFSEEQLIELAAVAGYENMRARANRVFDVGSDGLCSLMASSAESGAEADAARAYAADAEVRR
jgi:alkylhydroperoxidase family enzyme